MTETQIPAASTAQDRATDAELAARARDGDRDAFAALYERHAGRVYNFLIDLVQDEADAEDLMQTTFLRALRGIGKPARR
jgi:RNA polymerase sigma-70 factor, ECF subfamily